MLKSALKKFFAIAIANPKSSIQGLASLILAIVLAYAGLPKGASALVVLIGTLKAIVGFLQTDAGKQLAFMPGQAEPQQVPSHETPDDPTAKPVV